MELSKDTGKDWSEFYERAVLLPEPEYTKHFLSKVLEGGRVLDFGAGNGRWAAAFLRDRPDLEIDVIDKNIEKASLLPDDWQGKKINSSFQEFCPTKQYDGIWSFASLFFLKKDELDVCFNKLASSLKENGIISFTMVDDCHVAKASSFNGLSKNDIEKMLKKENLELVAIKLNNHAEYFAGKVKIPTYHMVARKLSC